MTDVPHMIAPARGERCPISKSQGAWTVANIQGHLLDS